MTHEHHRAGALIQGILDGGQSSHDSTMQNIHKTQREKHAVITVMSSNTPIQQ